jgi:hypothetical protein
MTRSFFNRQFLYGFAWFAVCFILFVEIGR